MIWLISASPKDYDHSRSFEQHDFIDWKQSNIKYQVNDIVYVYVSSPVKSIRYKCKIETIDLTRDTIRNDEKYWLNKSKYNEALNGKFMRLKLIDYISTDELSFANLIENGLKGAPQKPKKLETNKEQDQELLNYIESQFADTTIFYSEILEDKGIVYEGLKKKVLVNRYERSQIARKKCIEYHGDNCSVCNMNFNKRYGDIGKGFIHVHHVIPMHQINKEYQVDYKKDLIYMVKHLSHALKPYIFCSLRLIRISNNLYF